MIVVEPATVNKAEGEEELIPTLPPEATVRKEAPEEEVTFRTLVAEPELPTKVSLAPGVVVPTPTFPEETTYRAGTEEAVTENGFKVEPLLLVKLNKVPVPVLLALSFKVNKLLLAVEFPQVKVVVVVAMDKARLAVGLLKPDHALPVPVPQAWSVVLHKILTVLPSTILNLPAVES